MDLVVIHRAMVAAGIPLVSVESPDGVKIVLRFADTVTVDQRQQAQVIADQLKTAVVPDYDRFKALLRGGGLFAAALSTTDEKAWAVLLTTIESGDEPTDAGRMADFYWSLHQVYAGLPEPLVAEQLQQLNGHLAACGFGFKLA